MGFKHTQSLISEDISSHFVQGEHVKAFDLEAVKTHVLKLREELDVLVERNYSYVEMLREKERNAQNKRRHHLIQFQQGDWVFVSYHETQHDSDKTRLKWLGPQLVEDVISDDVYLVSNLLGHSQVIHASRMWYYEGPDYTPCKAVSEVFKRDFKELILEKILSHRRDKYSGDYEVLIKWMGFQDDYNSWEPLNAIALTHGDVLREYFESRKIALPAVLKSKQLKEVKVYKNPNLCKTWTDMEKVVLRSVILKFGFGSWYYLKHYLPSKTYQQIYDHLQRYLYFFDFSICNGLRFDVDELHHTLALRIAEINTSNVFTRKRNALVRKKVTVASPTLMTRDEIKSLCTAVEPVEILLPVISNRKTELSCFRDVRFASYKKAIILLFQKMVDEKVLQALREKVSVLKQASFQGEYITLSSRISLTELDVHITSAQVICKVSKRLSGEISESQRYFRQLVNTDECYMVRLETKGPPIFVGKENPYTEDIRFTEITNNVFKLSEKSSHSSLISVSPQGSTSIEIEITPSSFATLWKKDGRCDVLITDPPWKVGGGHPIPELNFTLKYRVEEFEDLMEIRYDSALKEGGLLCIWVVNAHLHKVVHRLKTYGLLFQRVVTWVKTGKDGRLIQSLGHYFSHSTETCLLFTKGAPNEFSKRVLKCVPEIFLAPRTTASAKPQHLHRIVVEVASVSERGQLRFLDVYGRVNNLEPYWITAGLQATEFSLL